MECTGERPVTEVNEMADKGPPMSVPAFVPAATVAQILRDAAAVAHRKSSVTKRSEQQSHVAVAEALDTIAEAFERFHFDESAYFSPEGTGEFEGWFEKRD